MTSLNLYYLLKVCLYIQSRWEAGSSIQSTAPDKGMLLSDKVRRWSPTFMAPGTSFVEHKFSTDLGDGFGVIQAHYIIVHFISIITL